jgi:hypothetical protein
MSGEICVYHKERRNPGCYRSVIKDNRSIMKGTTCRTRYLLEYISPAIRGIFPQLLSCKSLRMLYNRWTFGCDRPVMKDTSFGEKCRYLRDCKLRAIRGIFLKLHTNESQPMSNKGYKVAYDRSIMRGTLLREPHTPFEGFFRKSTRKSRYASPSNRVSLVAIGL